MRLNEEDTCTLACSVHGVCPGRLRRARPAASDAPEGGDAQVSDAPEGGDTTGDKVIKIGVFEPQSGDNGAGGKQEILGMQYANS